MSDLVAVGVIAALICLAFCGYWFTSVVSPPAEGAQQQGRLISSMYDPPANAIEASLVKGDGQLYAGQATDPLVRRPEMVRGGDAEQAYRYQRPLYGWIGWLASAGQPGAVAVALIVVTAASVVALVLAVGRWFLAVGADPRWALLTFFVPGVAVDLVVVGPEALGAALVVTGLHRWLRPTPGGSTPLVAARGPDWVAVGCFALAGLCRETLLLVPFVLMVQAMVAGRWRHAVGAALAAGPYLVWVAFLFVRVGALPRGSVSGRLSVVPFGGLVAASEGWAVAEVVLSVGLVAIAVAAMVVGAGTGLRPVIAAHLLLAAALGQPVWNRFPDFGRVLLPLGVLSLVAVVAGLHSSAKAGASTRGDGADGVGNPAAGEDARDRVSARAVHPAT